MSNVKYLRSQHFFLRALLVTVLGLLGIATARGQPEHGNTNSKIQLSGAEYEEGKSLCQKNEGIVFSCKIKKKMVSLCASEDLSPSKGVLFYRFGKLGKEPELSYPEKNIHPEKAFRLIRVSGTKGWEEYVSFSRGSITYVVYSGKWVYAGEWHGIMVDGPEKEVMKEMPCTGEMIDHIETLFANTGYGLKAEDGEDWSHPLPPLPSGIKP